MKLVLLGFLILLSYSLHAQIADSSSQEANSTTEVPVKKTLCLLTGLNYNSHVFPEIGLSVNFSPSGTLHTASGSYYFANELHLVNRPFIGPKVGFCISVFIWSFAANVIYYTDFKRQSAFALRPEIGVGVDRFRIMYGFNKVLNESVNRLSRNNIGIVFCFKLKQLKMTDTKAVNLN